MFQQFQNLRKSQSDPKNMINDIIGKYSPEQMAKFREFANGFGITNEQLSNFGINVK